MKNIVKTGLLALLLTVLISPTAIYAATSPSLGTAASFSILAETQITNVPNSVIGRDVGLSPASGSFIALTDAEVAGTIYAVDGAAPLAANATVNPGLLTTAINDMMTVWSTGGSTGIDQPCTTTYAGVQDLTIVSPLGPGVYCADAFLLTGNLTLSGAGVWIFKSASTLTTSAGSTVTGGDPCNVWWRTVSAGASLGANSSMIGNILSGTSISMVTGATLNGRTLSQAAVNLDQNTINGPVCVPSLGPSATTTTTGLPSTGLAQQENSSTVVDIGAIIFTMLLAGFLVRRKYSDAA